jgi:hypothetical protein
MPSGTGVTSDAIPIQTAGITAYIATDYVATGGITGHYQLIKLGYGVDGSATVVNSSNPLPVTIATGMTATISGFTGTIDVRGVGGAAVVVSGSVVTTGLTSSPMWVKTFTGSQVEVTGGRYLGKATDSVSVWGPSGLTYIYANLVSSSGSALSTTNGALNVNITGATISASIPSTVTVVGLSGATAVSTIGVNDTNILNGITSINSQVIGLRTDLQALGVGRATTFKTGRASASAASPVQMDSAGYTCYAGINIRAISTNTDFIYLGSSNALVGACGYALDPGENVFLNVQNTNTVYVLSNTGTQIVTYMAS